MAERVFVSSSRAEAHRALEYVNGQRPAAGPDPDFPGLDPATLAATAYVGAECRENHDDGVFEVWSAADLERR